MQILLAESFIDGIFTSSHLYSTLAEVAKSLLQYKNRCDASFAGNPMSNALWTWLLSSACLLAINRNLMRFLHVCRYVSFEGSCSALWGWVGASVEGSVTIQWDPVGVCNGDGSWTAWDAKYVCNAAERSKRFRMRFEGKAGMLDVVLLRNCCRSKGRYVVII